MKREQLLALMAAILCSGSNVEAIDADLAEEAVASAELILEAAQGWKS